MASNSQQFASVNSQASQPDPIAKQSGELLQVSDSVNTGELPCALLGLIKGRVLALSADPEGSRQVQGALEVVDQKLAAELAWELRWHVKKTIESPHGNFVIQRCVEVLPIASVCFIVEELRGLGDWASRHRFGCRVMCRILEHSCGPKLIADVSKLIEEVLDHTEKLCRHSYGHHVIRALLEHGMCHHRHRIALALTDDLVYNATNRNASSVVEMALQCCSVKDKSVMSAGILSSRDKVQKLAKNHYGFFVLKALLKENRECCLNTLVQLQTEAPQNQYRHDKYIKNVRRLLEEAQASS